MVPKAKRYDSRERLKWTKRLAAGAQIMCTFGAMK